MRTFNKATAWFVILAFVTLLQVSATPLRAKPAPAAAETSMSSPEQGPGVIEEEGAPPAGAKKKSIVPLVLIGVGIAAVAVLALVVLKTKYDPVGTWVGPMSSPSQNWTGHMVLSGDKKSGTARYSDPWWTNLPGSYTLDGKNITINISIGGQNIKFTGAFSSKDAMSGTWVNESTPALTGPWSFTRAASGASLPAQPAAAAGAKGLVR